METLKIEQKEITNLLKKMDDKLSRCEIKSNLVEEEIEIDVKYIRGTQGLKMIIDRGAPLLIVNDKWLQKYLKEIRVDEKESQERSCKSIKFGEKVHSSRRETVMPIVLKTREKNYIKKMIMASVIHRDEALFLCSLNTLQGWRATVFYDKVEFIEIEKIFEGNVEGW